MGSDILQEKWMKGVAVTTTVLAVMTSIVSARSAACVSKIQIQTAVEGNAWSYFQAKSIKQHFADAQHRAFAIEALGAANPEQKAAFTQELDKLVSESARYEQEKIQIKSQAEEAGRQKERAQRQNNLFVIATALFQIAIMLSSVGALIKRMELWIIGLVFGVVAVFFFLNGFFLFVPLPFVF